MYIFLHAGRCSSKMGLTVVLVVLTVCHFCTGIIVYDRGSEEIRPFFRIYDDFGHRINDWIKNVKTRVIERLFGGSDSQSLENSEDSNENDVQTKTLQGTHRYFLDLSTLTFDPQRDWGFRIGNWYFIRKADDSYNDFGDDMFDTRKKTQSPTRTEQPKRPTVKPDRVLSTTAITRDETSFTTTEVDWTSVEDINKSTKGTQTATSSSERTTETSVTKTNTQDTQGYVLSETTTVGVRKYTRGNEAIDNQVYSAEVVLI